MKAVELPRSNGSSHASYEIRVFVLFVGERCVRVTPNGKDRRKQLRDDDVADSFRLI